MDKLKSNKYSVGDIVLVKGIEVRIDTVKQEKHDVYYGVTFLSKHVGVPSISISERNIDGFAK